MRTLLAGLVAGFMTTAVLVAPAAGQDVTLTVHHFLSPKSATHAAFIQPWAERIEAESDGRIKVEIYPSMALGGKPPELYRQVRDGAADIVWTLIGYTPGVFPRAEVFELPSVHRGSALATNLAIQDNFDLIAEDFEDLKPILVHVHAGNALHMRDKPVTSPEDVAGLKLRTPSRTGAWMIESWDAEPVGMPVPALPEALSKGTVDGALIPFEIMVPLKVQELSDYSVEGQDGARFGTSVFLFAMNKERYETLPDDLKAIIDANSGAALASDIGKLWDEVEAPGKAAQIESGGEVITLDAAATDAFAARADRVTQRWIEEATANGIDGLALVEAARSAVQKHSQGQ